MKVAGFLRMLPLSLGPVLPIFSTSEEPDRRFIQVISESGLVSNFVPIAPLSKERLIIQDEPSYPEVLIGQEALLAFDRGDSSVSLRRGEKYRQLLSELLTSKGDTISSFAALEMSLLVGDSKRAVEAAKMCVSLMGGPNSILAQRWIAGGTIPDEIRHLLNSPSSEAASAFAEEDGKYWIVTIGGPKFLVRGLTLFCSDVFQTTRAHAIRRIFTSGALDPIPTLSDISVVCSGISTLLDRTPNVGRYLMRTRTSWGRIDLGYGIDPNWLSPIYGDFNRILSDSGELLRLRISGIDLNNNRGRLLLFLWSYFLKSTGHLTYIQDRLNLSEMHSGSEIDRAASATTSG